MHYKPLITSDITDIRSRFIKAFILLIIVETITRFILCLSFPSKIYALSLAGIFCLYVSLYIVYDRKAFKEPYAVAVILSFYFLMRFAYLMGTYNHLPIMFLWLLPIPIIARIYYSNKVSIYIAIITVLAVIFMTQVAALTDISNHYEEIVIDHYGGHASGFIVKWFVLLVFIYIALAVYYLIKVLLVQHSSPGIQLTSDLIQETGKENSVFSRKKEVHHESLPGKNSAGNIQSIRDVRLQGIYQLVLDHMEKSECYLNADYTLGQLAKDVKIHRTTLSNALNNAGGISFNDLLNRYRINKAKELFSDDSFRSSNIKQTYMNVGFKYNTTFNRVFKKQEGMTPTEYIIGMRNSN